LQQTYCVNTERFYDPESSYSWCRALTDTVIWNIFKLNLPRTSIYLFLKAVADKTIYRTVGLVS
jgi:hypothetical protein